MTTFIARMVRLPVPAFAMVLFGVPASGQQPADLALTRAAGDSAIVHHDWRRLIKVYEPVTRAKPDDGMAWFRLGAGLQESGDAKAASAALQQAVRLKFQPAQSEFRLARAFARTRMLDSVVPHLALATTAGTAVEMITSEPDLAMVRGRPDYLALIHDLEDVRYPCRKLPEAHQFDFWIGDWAVTPWGGPSVSLGRQAVNHVSAELEHCVVHERWTSSTTGRGESMNFWDPNRHAWRQVWMDEGQWSLDYEGTYSDGAMRFHGWTLGPNEERRLEKLTFFNVAPDTVRQLFEQSPDGGKTWTATFDGRYVRLRASKR